MAPMLRSSSSEHSSKRQRTADDENHQSNEHFERLKTANRASVVLPREAPHDLGSGHMSLKAAPNHWNQLVKLHKNLSTVAGVTWGNGSATEDPRRRMYGFLPTQRQRLLDAGIRVQEEGREDEDEHEFAMSPDVSMDLVEATKNDQKPHVNILTKGMSDALEYVTKCIHDSVPGEYKKYVSLDELVAVQPNHHNGATYLPAHLDEARSDGFGVVIATLCICKAKDSKLILIDEGDTDKDKPLSWSLELEDKDCYWLSGDARNKCHHGILSENNPNRQTLNLRYGLHSVAFAEAEIERHWRNGEKQTTS